MKLDLHKRGQNLAQGLCFAICPFLKGCQTQWYHQRCVLMNELHYTFDHSTDVSRDYWQTYFPIDATGFYIYHNENSCKAAADGLFSTSKQSWNKGQTIQVLSKIINATRFNKDCTNLTFIFRNVLGVLAHLDNLIMVNHLNWEVNLLMWHVLTDGEPRYNDDECK